MKAKELLLGFVACASMSFGVEAATHSRVFVNVDHVIDQCSAGKQLAQWVQAQQKGLQDFIQQEEQSLKASREALLSQELSPEAMRVKAISLEAAQKRAELAIQEKNAEISAEFENKRAGLRSAVAQKVQSLAEKNGWDEVSPPAAALYVKPELDMTQAVLEAYNVDAQEAIAKSMLRGDSAKAPEFLNA